MRINAFIPAIMLCCFCVVGMVAQIQVNYLKGKQESYRAGDKIEVLVKLKTLPETCQSGMKQAKVFVSGLEIEKQTDWTELAKGLWQKQLSLTIISNDKKSAKLTIMRKVDKESLFHQEIFPVDYKNK